MSSLYDMPPEIQVEADGPERAVLATIDYATSAEEVTFSSDDFRATIEKLTERKRG